MSKFVITFAGAPGSSKTPIAHYLSWKLNLPIFSNDCIRTEVFEDMGRMEEDEYIKRRDERLRQIFKTDLSFIYDASVDRGWSFIKNMAGHDYRFFIISLDFKREFLESLYKTKNYLEALKKVDNMKNDHDKFLEEYGKDIGFHLEERGFSDRLEISYQKTKEWLTSI